MNTLTKMALGLIGQLQPHSPTGDGSQAVTLPLVQALAQTVGWPAGAASV